MPSAPSPTTSSSTSPNAAAAPPTYKSHPVWGALFEFRDGPLQTLERISALGGAVALRAGLTRLVLATSPDAVNHVLVTQGRQYGKQTRAYTLLRMTLGRGLVTSEGELWKTQRRTIQPLFHKQRIAGFGQTMVAVSEDTLARWKRMPAQEPVDIHQEMMRLTLQVVCKTLLSIDVTDEVGAVGEALHVIGEHTNRMALNPLLPPLWVPTRENRRMRKALDVLDAIVHRSIDDKRQRGTRGENGDLLDMLMEARDEETGERMSDQQLRDEVMTLFTAGHDTTANGLTWTLYMLSRHPQVLRQVQAELSQVLSGRHPTIDDLSKLALLDRVIKESLRLYPPVWIVERSPVARDSLGGHTVNPGDVVLLSPWATHRLPQYWPQPDRFDPDRFLPEAEAQRPKSAYIPFITGNRKCIGDMFAHTELRLVLATLLQHVEPHVPPGHEVALEALITLRPKNGLPMHLRRTDS